MAVDYGSVTDILRRQSESSNKDLQSLFLKQQANLRNAAIARQKKKSQLATMRAAQDRERLGDPETLGASAADFYRNQFIDDSESDYYGGLNQAQSEYMRGKIGLESDFARQQADLEKAGIEQRYQEKKDEADWTDYLGMGLNVGSTLVGLLSDPKKKKKIKKLTKEKAQEKLEETQPFTFIYKDDPQQKERMGYMATDFKDALKNHFDGKVISMGDLAEVSAAQTELLLSLEDDIEKLKSRRK